MTCAARSSGRVLRRVPFQGAADRAAAGGDEDGVLSVVMAISS
jgi:hypothetical protein